jgi:hypothetical protein
VSVFHQKFQRSTDVSFLQHESDWKMSFDIAKKILKKLMNVKNIKKLIIIN